MPSKKLPPVLLNLKNSGSFKLASSQDSTASFASAASNNSEVVSEAAGPAHSSTAARPPPACSGDSSKDGVSPAVGVSFTAANGQAGAASSTDAADVAYEADHGRPESSQTSAELKGDGTAQASVNGTTSMTAGLPPPSEHSSEGPLHHASAAGSTGDAAGGDRMLKTGSLQHGRPQQGTGQGDDPPEAEVSPGSAAQDPGAQDLPRPAHRLPGSAADQSASEEPASSEGGPEKKHSGFNDPLQSSRPSHDTHGGGAAPSSTEQQHTEAGSAREQARQRHVRETSLDAWMEHAQLQPRPLDSPEQPGWFCQVPQAGSGPNEDQYGQPSNSNHVRDSRPPSAADGRADQSDEVQRNSQHLGCAKGEESHRKQPGAPGTSKRLGDSHLQAADNGREQPSQLHGQRSASPGPEPSEELPVSTLGARCLSGALGPSLPEPPDSTQALLGAQAGASEAERAEKGTPSQQGDLTCMCQQPAAVPCGKHAGKETRTRA